jgi:putative phosphoribosyl transferase
MLTHDYNDEIRIPLNHIKLSGTLTIPHGADSIIVFAHSSGRHTSKNHYIARVLQKIGLATLLFDLLTVYEDRNYANRFEVELLSDRLLTVTAWLKSRAQTSEMSIGYLGTSTGAAAALIAAAKLGDEIKAVVSKGGRPDLASHILKYVKSPTLFIVGGLDDLALSLNKNAISLLTSEKELIIVNGATHLFEEPGKVEEVADYASDWLLRHLIKTAA